MLHVKFDSEWPSGFSKKKMSEHCERTKTTTTTDARALVYYKLTFWASRLRWAKKKKKKKHEKMTCATSLGIRLRCPHEETLGP